MSVCTCRRMESSKYQELAEAFLRNLAPDGVLAQSNWSLLSLCDMYEAGNSLEAIQEVVPFRSDECTRSLRCCGMCTRQCYSRCLMDCLHRLHMWTQVAMTAESEFESDEPPLNFQLLACTKFNSYRELSYTIGDILSPQKNVKVRAYMQEHQLRPEENPYKLDYAAQPMRDSQGKKLVDRTTGAIKIDTWPKSGLCPFCLPSIAAVTNSRDRRKSKPD